MMGIWKNVGHGETTLQISLNVGMAQLLADIAKKKGYSSGQLNPGQVGWSVGNEGDWRSCSGMACIERIDNRGRQNSDHVRRVAEGGFEAWRQLHMQFEPKLVIRQGQVLADFSDMVSGPAKCIAETRDILTELEPRTGVVRDLTEQDVSDMHARSVLTGILDPQTRQHTAYRQADPFEHKNSVFEFVNAAGSSQGELKKSDPMQVGRVEEGTTKCRIRCRGFF